MEGKADDLRRSEYPADIQVHEEIKAHLQQYYIAVDTLGGHEKYAGSFAQDAILTLPTGSKVHGREALRKLHENMWGGVDRRLHRPTKIFPFGKNAIELMVLGSVEYWGTDGSYTKKEMVSHFTYERNPISSAFEVQALSVWLK